VRGNNFGAAELEVRLLSELSKIRNSATEPAMIGINDNSEQMDYKTSRSICDAVGERLQRDLRPEHSDLSPQLKDLLNEMRRQDDDFAGR
jgi:hypothetical protein